MCHIWDKSYFSQCEDIFNLTNCDSTHKEDAGHTEQLSVSKELCLKVDSITWPYNMHAIVDSGKMSEYCLPDYRSKYTDSFLEEYTLETGISPYVQTIPIH